MASKSFFALLTLVLSVSVSALPSRRQAEGGPLPGWDPVGCHTDSAVPRTLADASFADADMTPALCTAFCEAGGYGYSGVEFGVECFCGYIIQPGGALVSDAQCSVPCGGDPTLTCGAGNRVFIYTNGQPPPSAPATVDTWEYQGCYTDLVESEVRTLLRRIEIPEVVNINTCTAGCKAENHIYAGLEYGGECWCGDEILAGTLVPDSQCAMTCVGDRTQICGGPFRLTIYLDGESVPEPTPSEDPEEPEPTPTEEPEEPEPTPTEEPEEPEPTPTEEPEEPEPTEEVPEEPTPTEEVPEEPTPTEEPVPEEPAPEDPEA